MTKYTGNNAVLILVEKAEFAQSYIYQPKSCFREFLGNSFILSCLLYADDLVFLAETEVNLQKMIDFLYQWCCDWRIEVNLDKTNIMHVRKAHCRRSNYEFKFGDKIIKFCNKYKYLGSTINEFLNFEVTANELSDPAGRALGFIVTKMIKNGGFPVNVYKILFDNENPKSIVSELMNRDLVGE